MSHQPHPFIEPRSPFARTQIELYPQEWLELVCFHLEDEDGNPTLFGVYGWIFNAHALSFARRYLDAYFHGVPVDLGHPFLDYGEFADSDEKERVRLVRLGEPGYHPERGLRMTLVPLSEAKEAPAHDVPDLARHPEPTRTNPDQPQRP